MARALNATSNVEAGGTGEIGPGEATVAWGEEGRCESCLWVKGCSVTEKLSFTRAVP